MSEIYSKIEIKMAKAERKERLKMKDMFKDGDGLWENSIFGNGKSQR